MAATRNRPSPDPARQVADFFGPRLQRAGRVCVALSGGADSVALLHALAELRASVPQLELSALHVHHGLSANADVWADFCAARCRDLAIPMALAQVAVDRSSREGIEGAARRARYAAFARVDTDWLALAQHRDDQAETLLLNLLRGSGVGGLAAMPEERPLAGGGASLVRPFLSVSRTVIVDWLQGRGLSWIEDESNEDVRLRRNFLRQEVLPLMARSFPEPGSGLARAAAHLGETQLLAAEIAQEDAQAAVVDGALCLAALARLSLARRANLMRHWLQARGARMPDARHLAEILRQLATSAADRAPAFRVDGLHLQASRGRLHCIPAAAAEESLRVWRDEPALDWPGGQVRFAATTGRGLSQQALAGTRLELRVRRGGEVLQPDPRRPRRSLKKLLQEAGLPLWQRATLPLLWSDDRLVWVAGIGCDAAVQAAPGEAGWLPDWPFSQRPAPPAGG